MNDNSVTKRVYHKPEIEFVATNLDFQLLNGSFQGGHNGATSGGDLGDSGDNGHTSAESGGGMGDAKRATFVPNSWDEIGSSNLWDD